MFTIFYYVQQPKIYRLSTLWFLHRIYLYLHYITLSLSLTYSHLHKFIYIYLFMIKLVCTLSYVSKSHALVDKYNTLFSLTWSTFVVTIISFCTKYFVQKCHLNHWMVKGYILIFATCYYFYVHTVWKCFPVLIFSMDSSEVKTFLLWSEM